MQPLVISGEWKIAVKYLKFASIIAEDIVDTDYYVYCEKCIEEEFVDVELFDKYQKEYLESLKKGNGSRAPYPLPDNAQIIS